MEHLERIFDDFQESPTKAITMLYLMFIEKSAKEKDLKMTLTGIKKLQEIYCV